MGWRFRKSFSPIPGVLLTLSPSGISTSVGAGPFRITAGPRGAAFTANIPGTGLSFRQPLRVNTPIQHGRPAPQAFVQVPFPAVQQPMQEVRSAGSGELTTPGLGEFKRLLMQARTEHQTITSELALARRAEGDAVKLHARWRDGWLMKRIQKARFQQLEQAAQQASEIRAELEEQKSLASLHTQIDLPDTTRSAFLRMSDAFAPLKSAARIWDTVQQRGTNKVAERTSAARTIEREPVQFQLGSCEVIKTDWLVPHLGNANGGDIYLYPGFALYFISDQAFALLELHELELEFAYSQFIETEAIPSDAKVIGKTWAKVNKDGTPDRRFKGNYEIPIAQYGRLTLRSKTGMNEEYLVSNAEAAGVFANAWNEFRRAAATR